jgi:membrane-associated protein
MCGVIGVDKKKFFFYNALGAVIWTESVIGLGLVLGDKLEGSVDAYLLPIIGTIVFISLIPVFIELFREWQTRKHHK